MWGAGRVIRQRFHIRTTFATATIKSPLSQSLSTQPTNEIAGLNSSFPTSSTSLGGSKLEQDASPRLLALWGAGNMPHDDTGDVVNMGGVVGSGKHAGHMMIRGMLHAQQRETCHDMMIRGMLQTKEKK